MPAVDPPDEPQTPGASPGTGSDQAAASGSDGGGPDNPLPAPGADGTPEPHDPEQDGGRPPDDVADPDPRDEPAWVRRLDEDRSQIIPLAPSRPRAEALAAIAGEPDEPPRSGILVIDKPKGRTSFDVVKAVRKAADERRVGHAGTLDPMATGVLVVCFGTATRVIEEIQAGRKTYIARVTLGVATNTYDAEGDVTREDDPSEIELSDVERELDRFRGDIMQRPPMYSAIKRKGKRLYELARKGIEVDVPPRPVTVYDLRVVDWSSPDVTLEMTVSRGTYVRSIAHDLGEALDVGAHLSALQRTAVGRFGIDDAESLHRVVEAFSQGWWPLLTYPLDTALLDYDAMIVGPTGEDDMRHGRQFDGPPPSTDLEDHIRVYDADGILIGLARYDPVHERWQPDRVFPAKTPGRPR